MVNGYRFIGIAPEVDLTERRSKMINDQTEPFTFDDMRGYKSFTALLTQSGGDNIQYLGSGELTIGVTYTIGFSTPGGDTGDFLNVGAPNNNIGTSFIATGTIPNAWGADSSLSYNTGAPVVTVLDNTIGNMWFSYEKSGIYNVQSINLFTLNKSSIIIGNVTWDGGYGIIKSGFDGESIAQIVTVNSTTNEHENTGSLVNTLIEIRVYN